MTQADGMTAIFIDGGYYHKIRTCEFNLPKTDVWRLSQLMSEGASVLRTYYYDCRIWTSNDATESEREAYNRQHRYLHRLEHMPNFSVKLGYLARRGFDNSGKSIYRQKQVDVLLAVDLVRLSVQKKISRAFLLAGDADFIPAVTAAQEEGVVVRLFHGTNVSDELKVACQETELLKRSMFEAAQPPV